MTEQRKLAAVMFTDIIGYTALMSRDEQKALALLQKNRKLQKSLAEKHNGEFLKEMGDGTLLCFQSALDAVKCAIAIQESVKDDSDLNLRIGIHLGDIVFRDGDVYGNGVNVASRIERLAESGCVCISEEVFRSVRNQPEIGAVFLEEKRLKNVDHPVKIYTLSGKGVKSSKHGLQWQKESDSKGKSIIVLPFEDMSPDKDNEYFSDGLTEEIITDLSHIHDLLVISRNSAMTFKGTKKKTNEIAKEVNVQYVLEGSVRKAGNSLRITAQLIDAKTDVHLWAEKYRGTLDDVFDIQEKVSRSIVDALKVKISSKEDKRIAERPIDNAQAYECYLKARQEMWKWTEDGLDRAMQFIQSGLDIIGDNELFYIAMGMIYCQYVNFVIKKDESVLIKAEECAQKAFSLNSESSRCHYLMGFIQLWRGNIRESVNGVKKALDIDPNYSDALILLGYFYGMSGKEYAGEPLFNVIKRGQENPGTIVTSLKVEKREGPRCPSLRVETG